jgi:hypothetical protein
VASLGEADAFGPVDLAAVLEAAQGARPDPEPVGAVMLRHGLTPAAHPTS